MTPFTHSYVKYMCVKYVEDSFEFVWSVVRTSTQVSISENRFMIGRMVSMELPERRSDLLPTRMMGILRQQKENFFYGTPKKCRCTYIRTEYKNILASFLSSTVHQRNPFSPDLREQIEENQFRENKRQKYTDNVKLIPCQWFPLVWHHKPHTQHWPTNEKII